jgi:hypothetical protein
MAMGKLQGKVAVITGGTDDMDETLLPVIASALMDYWLGRWRWWGGDGAVARLRIPPSSPGEVSFAFYLPVNGRRAMLTDHRALGRQPPESLLRLCATGRSW